MELPVLLQRIEGKGFMAIVGPPFNWTAEGATAAEALAKLQNDVSQSVRTEKCVRSIVVESVTTDDDPLALARSKGMLIEPRGGRGLKSWAGTWVDNPMIEDFIKAVHEYRMEKDRDENDS